MKLLITGGAGFVGSSLAISLKQNYPQYEIFALDNLKRRGSELSLARLKAAGIEFLHGDIRNKEDFDALPAVDTVIEASAEPSVLAGLDGTPDYLINTNLFGTVNCLNYALKHKANFIFLSTSRVYPIKTIETLNFEEADTRFVLTDDQPVPGVSSQRNCREFSARRCPVALRNYQAGFGTADSGIQRILRPENGHQSLWRHYRSVANGQGRSGRDGALDCQALFSSSNWRISATVARANKPVTCSTLPTSTG